ncbi:MAG: hypothetical protein ACOX6T_14665 [Myxococcales bacterium]|jgi:hypothetical protein
MPARIRPLVVALALSAPLPAKALELTRLDDRPLVLDISATSVASWHDDNRNSTVYDDNYGDLVNRLNLQFSYWRLVGALRLDTATFANVPDPTRLARENADPPDDIEQINDLQRQYWERLRSRYRDSYYVGKAWLSYASPSLELTVGDSYVSFGRGLALSLRKQDELAVDTTLLGGKVVARAPWVNFTAVAGIANPVKVDQASGQTLFALSPSPADIEAGREEVPVYGQDRIFGARAELTHGGGALGVHGVRLMRADTLGARQGTRAADTVDIAGGSLAAPFPRGVGSAYLEGAWQHWSGKLPDGGGFQDDGYALYGSLNAGYGPITGLVELQHYRDFDSLLASVDARNAESFLSLRYSAPPTTEPATNDTRFNYFDRCVTGGRARLDGQIIDRKLLAHVAVGRWATWGERSSECGAPDAKRNDVSDASAGMELIFDGASSHALVTAGMRRDTKAEDGLLYYREFRAELSLVKRLVGPWSIELDAKHRRRFYTEENLVGAGYGPEPWNEQEIYLSLKYSPLIVAAIGYEHTGLAGHEPHYFNGTLVWKYLPGSSIRLFVGQQRGALKCVSGVCREFPPFEGAKLEWTQRY